MAITIRSATVADADLLGQMNRQLADDEQSRNPMSAASLAERMTKWLSEDWQAVIVEEENQPIGYALFQISHDYYAPSIPEVYVRQFFIARQQRGQGKGRQAFTLLIEEVFPKGSHVRLDVLATNPGGSQFWLSLGFQPYSTALRLSPRHTM